jgi:transcriptional regulator with XRE-family HTH domain
MDGLSVFAKRLREARKRKGISQERLGILAGIEASAASARVNQYERGKHAPAFGIAQNLAAVLEVPAEYFYAEDDGTAQMLLLFHHLSVEERTSVIESLEAQRLNAVQD